MIIFREKDVSYRLASEDGLVNAALRVRHDVYLSVGYIDHAYPDGVIPDRKDLFSSYLVAESDGRVLGTIRATPFLCSGDIIAKWDCLRDPNANTTVRSLSHGTTIEIGSLAVPRENRSMRVSWGLYKAMYLYSLMEGIEYWAMAVDIRAIRSIERLGWMSERIGDPLEYMGSECVLAVMDVRKQLKMIFERNQKYYHYMVSHDD